MRLNNLVDLGTVLPQFIDGKTPVTAAGTDHFLVLRGTGPGVLNKALVSTVPGVTSVGLSMPVADFTVTGSPVTASGTLTAAWKTQTRNKFLAAPAAASGTPGFRNIEAKDTIFPTVAMATPAIDWSLGSVFTYHLAADTTFSFVNSGSGQTIRVQLSQNAGPTFANANWTGVIYWRGRVVPVLTRSAGARDVYVFTQIGGFVYGYADHDFSTP